MAALWCKAVRMAMVLPVFCAVWAAAQSYPLDSAFMAVADSIVGEDCGEVMLVKKVVDPKDVYYALSCKTVPFSFDRIMKIVSAPSVATMSNPANPERVTANHRHGTEPGVW